MVVMVVVVVFEVLKARVKLTLHTCCRRPEVRRPKQPSRQPPRNRDYLSLADFGRRVSTLTLLGGSFRFPSSTSVEHVPDCIAPPLGFTCTVRQMRCCCSGITHVSNLALLALSLLTCAMACTFRNILQVQGSLSIGTIACTLCVLLWSGCSRNSKTFRCSPA